MVTISNIAPVMPESVYETLGNINQQIGNMPAVLDRTTLDALVNGEYDISLREYTDMNTYRTTMSVLYGNNSSSPLNSSLNTLLGYNNQNRTISVKDFIDRLGERGVSESDALRLYTAARAYSLTSVLNLNNSFVSARV